MNKKPVELPHQFGMLCEMFDDVLGPVWTDWDGIRRGHVHVPRREVATSDAYRDAIQNQMRELPDIIGTLGTVCRELIREAMRGDSGVGEEQVSLAVKRYADLVKHMLRVRVKVTAISPPDGWAEMHAGLLAAIDEQLEVARGLHEDLHRIQADPGAAVSPDGALRVHMTFGGPALDRLSPLLNESIERTRRPSGPTCAVVTACYGDEEAPEVVGMRRWREAVLRPSHAGRLVCRAYAAVSPTVAVLFRRSPSLATVGRAAVRCFLAWSGGAAPEMDRVAANRGKDAGSRAGRDRP